MTASIEVKPAPAIVADTDNKLLRFACLQDYYRVLEMLEDKSYKVIEQ